MPANSRKPPTIALHEMPGHQIRRLQQIAVAIFLQEVEPLALTPIQYAALQAVANSPGQDQRSLAGMIGLDTSTLGGVIDRLETRGLLVRSASPKDRRVRLLTLTEAGAGLLHEAVPAMRRAQRRMLEPLQVDERAEFLRLLQRLVEANNGMSRAPSEA